MTRTIVAVDPGTANTGVVVMDERGIIASRTISFDDTLGVDNVKLSQRANEIAERIVSMIPAGCESVVMEGFVPFQRYNRTSAQALVQTPFLVGYLCRALSNYNLTLQTSVEVLGYTRPLSVLYGCETKEEGRQRKVDVIASTKGGHLCTNDHTRSAACHGLYYWRTHRSE